MYDYFCTVFTPTYNRADLLTKLYSSLINQTNQDFEWVIVDDGSIDDTEMVVHEFILENKLSIKYIKVENGGKHRAINKGVSIAKGKVFAIVDSDDVLTNDAIGKLFDWFSKLKGKNYCGVAGNKGYFNGELVGKTFDGECITCSSIDRKKYHIEGDKFEVFFTDILKKFPFPEYENEKFMSEIVVWTRIAHAGYVIEWHNDIIYICEYLEEGLSSNNYKLLKENPKGYALRIQEQVKYANISVKQRLGYYSTYYYLNKDTKKLNTIKKELKVCNYFELILAIVMRKIIQLKRGTLNEFK